MPPVLVAQQVVLHELAQGTFNYGFGSVNDTYLFKNHREDLRRSPDPGCEGTGETKADSLYGKKFNCVYGQKYTNESISKIEIFRIRNPCFEKEDEVYFLEPEIPYLTTHAKEPPLYEHSGAFKNTPMLKYGTPLKVEEQNVSRDARILTRVAEYCMS